MHKIGVAKARCYNLVRLRRTIVATNPKLTKHYKIYNKWETPESQFLNWIVLAEPAAWVKLSRPRNAILEGAMFLISLLSKFTREDLSTRIELTDGIDEFLWSWWPGDCGRLLSGPLKANHPHNCRTKNWNQDPNPNPNPLFIWILLPRPIRRETRIGMLINSKNPEKPGNLKVMRLGNF